MTDDLVKRLRQKEFKVVTENGYTEIGYRWGPLFDEAADRIETLEAALTRIVWAEHNAELSSSTMIEMADIAHAALAGEKKDG